MLGSGSFWYVPGQIMVSQTENRRASFPCHLCRIAHPIITLIPLILRGRRSATPADLHQEVGLPILSLPIFVPVWCDWTLLSGWATTDIGGWQVRIQPLHGIG